MTFCAGRQSPANWIKDEKPFIGWKFFYFYLSKNRDLMAVSKLGAITIESPDDRTYFFSRARAKEDTCVHTRTGENSRALWPDARARIRPPLSSLASALSRLHALSWHSDGFLLALEHLESKSPGLSLVSLFWSTASRCNSFRRSRDHASTFDDIKSDDVEKAP